MKISNYILLSSLILLMPSAVQAQINEKSDTVTASLLDIRGINISTDLFGYAYSILDN